MSSIRFVWNNGVSFGWLSKALFDYFTAAGLAFPRLSMPGTADSGKFMVRRYKFPRPATSANTRIELVDAPWEDDPWPKPETGEISWEVLADPERNIRWGGFYVRIEDNLRFGHQLWPAKVHSMSLLGTEGDFCWPPEEKTVALHTRCRQYNQLKQLFTLLDCDEVFGWDADQAYDRDFQRHFPYHRDKAFRFAKEGTQVLVKRLEEPSTRQPPDGGATRIFIDPPEVAAYALGPQEYGAAWERERKALSDGIVGQSTSVGLVWKRGHAFGSIAERILTFFHRKNFRLYRWPDYPHFRNGGAFTVATSGPFLDFVDRPWEDDPWLVPATESIDWRILDSKGKHWASLATRRDANLPYLRDGKWEVVHLISLSFGGRLLSHFGETQAQFDILVQKYEQIKELYRFLDCDEAYCHEGSQYNGFRKQFPFERDKVFRFAKSGTQVFVKRMEERSMLPPLDWLDSRIFVDPPGVQALSPREYDQLRRTRKSIGSDLNVL